MILSDLQIMRHVIDASPEVKWGLCLGCFDLLHVGHIAHFKWAQKNCDGLIVALTADWAIDKGEGRPLAPLEERMHVIDALGCVDFVVPSNAKRGTLLLKTLKPDIYFKGPDRFGTLSPGLQEETEAVKDYGGMILFSPDKDVRHSTEMLNRIWKNELPR